MAFRLVYSKAHPEAHKTLSRKPEFGDFYKPSASQKKYEMAICRWWYACNRELLPRDSYNYFL